MCGVGGFAGGKSGLDRERNVSGSGVEVNAEVEVMSAGLCLESGAMLFAGVAMLLERLALMIQK